MLIDHLLIFIPPQPFKVSHFEKRLTKEIEFREGKVHPKHFVKEDNDAFDDALTKEQVSVPAFGQKPKNFQLVEGADATFVCKVDAKPLPNVSSSFQLCVNLISILNLNSLLLDIDSDVRGS